MRRDRIACREGQWQADHKLRGFSGKAGVQRDGGAGARALFERAGNAADVQGHRVVHHGRGRGRGRRGGGFAPDDDERLPRDDLGKDQNAGRAAHIERARALGHQHG